MHLISKIFLFICIPFVGIMALLGFLAEYLPFDFLENMSWWIWIVVAVAAALALFDLIVEGIRQGMKRKEELTYKEYYFRDQKETPPVPQFDPLTGRKLDEITEKPIPKYDSMTGKKLEESIIEPPKKSSISPVIVKETQTPVESSEEFTEQKKPKKLFKTEKIAQENLTDLCSICSNKILKNEIYVICPTCKAPAHSSHLNEWLKIKSVCPNCKKKLKNI